MNQLNIGQSLTLVGQGGTGQVVALLGSGTQGEVYRFRVGKTEYALKWYFVHQASRDQRDIIENLIQKGAPDARFLWPTDIVVDARLPNTFGYIMCIRPAHFKSLFDLMTRKAEPSFLHLVTATYQLVTSFHSLHAKGLCYRDISHGNIFLDEKTGDILICDNDNVTQNGSHHTGVMGTPRFMAPEIVRAEADPTADSDLFSLAVMLFYMLVLHHPLEGQLEANIRCFDPPAMKRIYGEQPVFIFDPNNRSNRPVVGYHDNALAYWPLYPEFLQKLFIQVFTEGLNDPSRRVRETVWSSALLQLRDCLWLCACGAENFADPIKAATAHVCWACNQHAADFMLLKMGTKHVVLGAKTQLFGHHTDKFKQFDFEVVQAKVVQHPQDPNIWGLQNLSGNSWRMTVGDGAVQSVDTGRSVPLARGVKIEFGHVVAEII